jgi:hypothetical protein
MWTPPDTRKTGTSPAESYFGRDRILGSGVMSVEPAAERLDQV